MKKIILWACIILSSNACANTSPAIFSLLAKAPSDQSIDYINNKKQFQLYSLLTEQRHPKTMDLSDQIAHNTGLGLETLFSVDQDISYKLAAMAHGPKDLAKLEAASRAIQKAILNGHTIYFYGTGSTGRLAEAVESSLWRPFWEKLATMPSWNKVKKRLPNINNQLKGEITGGDRALISSLEGFEDLQLIGKLQLIDNDIQKDDVVFAVTEGGETSAVIGTVLAAAGFYTAPSNNLYFIYNNPDQLLLPFDRSRKVLEDPLINKINLTTGPQAITGSTRMQATTISLYVSGVILEDAIYQILKQCGLTKKELTELGFAGPLSMSTRLQDFSKIQAEVAASAEQIVPWTNLEAHTYASHHKAIYFAQKALLPVFIDVTERAPTFRLAPLDPVTASIKKSWIQVWSPVQTQQEAWQLLLHRPFHGLEYTFYEKSFQNNINDVYLKKTALKSLKQANQGQQGLYDLSFSPTNTFHNGPAAGDLGVMILISNEKFSSPVFSKWLQLFAAKKADIVLVSVAPKKLTQQQIDAFKKISTHILFLQPRIIENDPLGLNQLIGLKMLLNAHSTAVMAKLGRVVGNTMTDVQPSNLKLIGRATYLIQLHVNSVLTNPNWIKKNGRIMPIRFSDANAVLFDAIDYVQKTGQSTEAPEVALSIVRILESFQQHRNVSWEQSRKILDKESLEKYLRQLNISGA